MNKERVLVPDTGSDGEMDVIEISVAEGDQLETEQTLIVLESDKATMEIPCPLAGKLVALKVKVGDKVKTGDLIAEVEAAADATTDKAPKPESDSTEPDADKSKKEAPADATASEKTGSAEKDSAQSDSAAETKASAETDAQGQATQNKADKPSAAEQTGQQVESADSDARTVHAGPAVRKFAREHGVDLAQVSPTGPRSRILQEDLRLFIKKQMQQARSGSAGNGPGGFAIPQPALPDFKQFGEISTQSMTKVHLKTAENMQRSWTIPHVTQFDEADITELETFRKGQAGTAQDKGLKLTPMPFLLKACAYALKALPQFNVSLDLARQQLIQKHYVHIAFAVDTPHGLFVPVIKDVDKKGLWQLAAECQDLAKRARDKKLSPAEMQGACFTISSLGSIGGSAFTPIVNFPEVAILGVSKAQMKPVYNERMELSPRLLMPLSLSYDHRAVNGADGARFTSLLAKLLGDLRELLL